MIEWEVTDSGLRALDGGNAELVIESQNLDLVRSGAELPRPTDATVTCSTSGVSVPAAVLYVTPLSGGETHELTTGQDTLSLPEDDYLIDIDGEIKTYMRVESALSIGRTPTYDAVDIQFPERTTTTVGLRSRAELPSHELTVPPTPGGLATALSHLHASHKTTGTDRSYPTLRGHPPLLTTGDEVAVPDQVVAATADTGIEIVTPPKFKPLFVLAPLAYYLQASVDVRERPRPVLRVPELDQEWELPDGPELERESERLLRQVFFLDCLVRNAGPYGTELSEASLLDTLGLDRGVLYDATPGERLVTYLSVAHNAIQHRIPDWHLSTYVDPASRHLSTIPFLLDRMSLVFTPRTSELAGSELVERSLDDFYRGQRGPGDVPSVDILKPELRAGRIHGWLAEGTPIDVFRSSPAAYLNRLQFLTDDRDGIAIDVVLNDEEMIDEHEDVAEIYRRRGEQLPIDVTVHRGLTSARLARTFESGSDFVHYIGHCETEGLRCPDGYMAASTIDRCRVETFFLNACGSYYEGRELIEQGAVAGAVTFSQVLNDHAVKVGSTFAKLLAHGFGIERALQLARCRIMMGKDYAVVGDGTHSLTQSENRIPATATVEPIEGADRFLLTYDQFSSRHTGSFYHPYLENNEFSYLCGNESEFTLGRDDLVSYLARAELPVVYDGDIHWSADLAAALGREGERPAG